MWNDPVMVSALSIGISFVLSLLVLGLSKPDYVMKIDSKSGDKVLAVNKLLAYSGLISVIIGLLVVIGMCLFKKSPQESLPISSFGRSYRFQTPFRMGSKCGMPPFKMGKSGGCGCG